MEMPFTAMNAIFISGSHLKKGSLFVSMQLKHHAAKLEQQPFPHRNHFNSAVNQKKEKGSSRRLTYVLIVALWAQTTIQITDDRRQ